MAIEVEQSGKCKVVVKVEVPAEEMERRLDEKLREFQSKAQLRGFRPGHAPRHLIERLFLKEIIDELKAAVVEETFGQAVDEHNLRPVGEPKFEEVEFERGKPLKYHVELFVLPDVTPPPYKGIKIGAPDPTPPEEEVEAEIEKLRHSRAQLTPIKDRKTRENDRLVVALEVVGEDGKRLFQTDHGYIALGMKTLFGVEIEDLPRLLEGRSVGEEVRFEFVVSEDSPLAGEKKEHAGKKATCTVKIKEIRGITYPDLNDEFAKQFGFESLEKMRKAIEERLLVTRRIKLEEELEERLLSALVERLEIELPDELLKQKAQVFGEYLRVKLKADNPNMSEEDLKAEVEKATEERFEDLRARLKRQLLVEAIAKAEKIFVTEEQVDEVIGRLAVANNIAAADLKQQMVESGQLSELRFELLERRVKQFLREKNEVSYKGKKWSIKLPEPAPSEETEDGKGEKESGSTDTDSD